MAFAAAGVRARTVLLSRVDFIRRSWACTQSDITGIREGDAGTSHSLFIRRQIPKITRRAEEEDPRWENYQLALLFCIFSSSLPHFVRTSNLCFSQLKTRREKRKGLKPIISVSFLAAKARSFPLRVSVLMNFEVLPFPIPWCIAVT